MAPRQADRQGRFRLRPGLGGRAGQAHRRRSGQAMAEFLVGLVCIMLLVAGLQQIALLSTGDFKAMTAARRSVASQQADPTFTEWRSFNFAMPTEPGPDGRNYTADDRHLTGDDSVYQDNNEGYLALVNSVGIDDQLIDAGRIPPHGDLKSSEVYSESTALHMIYGADQQSVPVSPFLNRILGNETITVGQQVWMPRWGAIP